MSPCLGGAPSAVFGSVPRDRQDGVRSQNMSGILRKALGKLRAAEGTCLTPVRAVDRPQRQGIRAIGFHRLVAIASIGVLSLLAACSTPGESTTSTALPIASSTSQTTEHGDAPSGSIVFQWIAGPGDGIYLMDSDGSDVQPLYPPDAIHPDWAHDGRRLAFEVPTPAGIDIYIGSVDGSPPTLLVDHAICPDFCIEVAHPAWSPDDATIAYVRNRYDVEEQRLIASTLEAVEVATGATQVLYTAPTDRFLGYPRWSPDGTQVVFVATFLDADPSAPVVGSAIFVIDATNPAAEPDALTEPEMFATYPDWSPTDDLIIFSTYDLGEFQSTDEASNLYTIRPDGSGMTAVTSFDRMDQRATQPTWTPDGLRIIFTLVGDSGPGAEYDGPRQAAFIDPDGRNLEVIDGSATHSRYR